ncbi:hypothetical protein [Pseudonocardia charpentierae]|uniref:Uncharacterized protein n=1 Tax=Pseudonocardia charpentierae TaxID=3075545 RepID=A0ABU2N8T9_9PSEU|nr:hypothetical protein [Pseudonocardia sp. DSM 45834]MDT0350347.1 hypothetical protein [Pseudonocardia sp. DSM 45834]
MLGYTQSAGRDLFERRRDGVTLTPEARDCSTALAAAAHCQ